MFRLVGVFCFRVKFVFLNSRMLNFAAQLLKLIRNNFQFFTVDPDIIRAMLTEITIFKKVDAIPNRALFGQRITGTNSFLTVTDGKTIN